MKKYIAYHGFVKTNTIAIYKGDHISYNYWDMQTMLGNYEDVIKSDSDSFVTIFEMVSKKQKIQEAMEYRALHKILQTLIDENFVWFKL